MTSAAAQHRDPPGEAPWAMQLVVRVEKTGPPTRTAACAAAAIAVVRLLAGERAATDWKPNIDRWLTGRIRKHVRRARGARWAAAQAIEGVTVLADGAEVRAFVPGPTDQIPRDLARLQLSGLTLPDRDGDADGEDLPAAGRLVVSINPSLSAGKAIAAAGHVGQLAAARLPAGRRDRWLAAGPAVTVTARSPSAFQAGCATDPVVVHDAGFTEVDPGTVTATGRWA